MKYINIWFGMYVWEKNVETPAIQKYPHGDKLM